MSAETDAAEQYFSTIAAALSGLEIFMRDDRSPLYRHGIVAKIVADLATEPGELGTGGLDRGGQPSMQPGAIGFQL